jgi:hypothetical protein
MFGTITGMDSPEHERRHVVEYMEAEAPDETVEHAEKITAERGGVALRLAAPWTARSGACDRGGGGCGRRLRVAVAFRRVVDYTDRWLVRLLL